MMSGRSNLLQFLRDAVSLFPAHSAVEALAKLGVKELHCSANGFASKRFDAVESLNAVAAGGPFKPLDEALGLLSSGAPLLLTFDCSACFSHELFIPAAAHREATAILLQEMEHCTPFSVPEIYHFQWMKEHDSNSELLFQQVILKRKAVDQLVDEISARNHTILAIGYRNEDGGLAPAFIQPNGLPFGDAKERRWIKIAATAAIVFAGCAAWSAWSATESTSLLLHSWQQEISALEQNLTAQRAVQEDANKAKAAVKQLLDRRESAFRTTEILAEITRELPDSAWLQAFEIGGEKGSIEGEAIYPAEVLQNLEESAMFKQVAFASPVYGNSQTGKQHFSISFQLEAR